MRVISSKTWLDLAVPAADEDEEGEDNGEGAQDFVLPKVERLTQRGQPMTWIMGASGQAR